MKRYILVEIDELPQDGERGYNEIRSLSDGTRVLYDVSPENAMQLATPEARINWYRETA